MLSVFGVHGEAVTGDKDDTSLEARVNNGPTYHRYHRNRTTRSIPCSTADDVSDDGRTVMCGSVLRLAVSAIQRRGGCKSREKVPVQVGGYK